MNFIIKFINFFINLIADVLNLLVDILPKSPFVGLNEFIDSTYLGYLCWIFPIKEIIDFLILWAGCIVLIYVFRYVLKFFRMG